MNLEKQIVSWFDKLEKGNLTESDKSEPLQIKLSAIARSIDVAIFPFMVATHFKYKNLFEVKKDFKNKWYLNKEQYKTTKELVNVYLFDRMLRNSEYQTPNTIITSLNTLLFGNNLEFQNKINSKMHDIWHKRDSYGPYEVLKHLKDSLTDYEKRQQGGVVTPLGLAEEMINQINIKDGNKVLDSACGYGTFLLVANKQNPKAKYFGIDISPQRCYIAKYIVPFAEIWCGDFLEKGFWMKKMDIIVGNPPFSEGKTNNKSTRGAQLYKKFLFLDLKLAPVVLLITPSLWTHKKGSIKTALCEHGLSKVTECTNRFENINISMAYFLAKKGHHCNLSITTKDKTNYVLTKFNNETSIFLEGSNKSAEIISKLHKASKVFLDSLWSRSSVYRNDNRIGSGITKMVDIGGMNPNSSPIIVEADINKEEFPGFDKYKVIINNVLGGYHLGTPKIVEPGIGTSYGVVSFPVNTLEEAKNLKSYLTSNLVTFVVKNVKNNGANSKSLFSNIPMIDMSIKMSDSEIYYLFGLTQEEIDLIESTIK